ncbi:MAG: hypothetical protein WC028_11945 [Candidatus Obscuribacterales bacterium]|jgi:hypothetical protein
MIKKILNSKKALTVLGASLLLAGVGAAVYIGIIDSPTTDEHVPLALFFAWTGLLALVMAWSFNLERIHICFGAMVLTIFSSVFGIALVTVANELAWPLIGAWSLCVSGGSLLGSLLLKPRI